MAPGRGSGRRVWTRGLAIVLLACPALPALADWGADVGVVAGWDSDVGDEYEMQGEAAPHAGLWAFGGYGWEVGERSRLQVGGGYDGRLPIGHDDLMAHGLSGRVGLSWLAGERWMFQVSPRASLRRYGDRSRDSFAAGLTLGGRFAGSQRTVVGIAGRVTVRETADPLYATQTASAGIDVDSRLTVRWRLEYGYDFAAVRWTGLEEGGSAPGAVWRTRPELDGTTRPHLNVHALHAGLRLDIEPVYLFGRYDWALLVLEGPFTHTVSTVSLGVGMSL